MGSAAREAFTGQVRPGADNEAINWHARWIECPRKSDWTKPMVSSCKPLHANGAGGRSLLSGPEVILNDLWGKGERPDLRDFLRPWLDRGLDMEDLLAVLCVDQRRRWLSGERVNFSV